MASKDKILAMFERRFDHHSARVALAEAAALAGIEDPGSMDAKGYRALAEAVLRLDGRADAVVEALREAADAAAPKAKAAASGDGAKKATTKKAAKGGKK